MIRGFLCGALMAASGQNVLNQEAVSLERVCEVDGDSSCAVNLMAKAAHKSRQRIPYRAVRDLLATERSFKQDPIPSTLSLPIHRSRFLYLSQGAADVPEWFADVAARDDCFGIWGTYKKQIPGAEKISTIYIPDSTWTTGRNQLYMAAAKMQVAQGWAYEYLVFCDQDAKISANHTDLDPYDLFHAALTNTQVALGAVPMEHDPRNHCGGPGSHWCSSCNDWELPSCAPDVDGIVNAFHATAAPIFLPYDAAFDATTWWGSQGIMSQVLLASAPEYVAQFNQFYINNSVNAHTDYPHSIDEFLIPPGSSFSKVATYTRGRVNACLRDNIRDVAGVTGQGCSQCDLVQSCKLGDLTCGAQARELRNYSELIDCQPFSDLPALWSFVALH